MKKTLLPSLVVFIVLFGCKPVKKQNTIPLAPKENRRPDNFQPFSYKYSLEELKDRYSEDMMQRAAKKYAEVQQVIEDGKWKATAESIDSHHAPEWFQDLKFGMWIDWGLWSIAGYAPKLEKKAMYPDWYEINYEKDSLCRLYHAKNWGEDFKRDDFIPLFTAEDYQPEKLIDIAKKAGMKYVIPFSKHHSGYCLWPSSYTQRNTVDMTPHRDLISPLAETCKKEGLKFGFYFSVEEWEYPLIGDNGQLETRLWGGKVEPYSSELERKASGKIAVRDFATDYIVPQATEFIDKYDPDILWYDGEWLTSAKDLHTYEMAAYYYDQAEGRKEVAVNDRYGRTDDWVKLRSIRGDFFCNEYGDQEEEIKKVVHPWEECRGISQSFGYNWQDTEDNVISGKAFVDKFVDVVSHGGNLLLIVNLDGQGALPKVEEKRLMDIGNWLEVNGDGIYATRPFVPRNQGTVSFTNSKDEKELYAIMKEWPGKELRLKGIHPAQGSEIKMLGYPEAFEWSYDNDELTVKMPEALQSEKNRPCSYAWTLKILLNSI